MNGSDRRNNVIAWIASAVFHLLLLLIFLFAVAWRAPNPPLPEYGFELNFGTDEAGSGAVQPRERSGTEVPAEPVQAKPESGQPDQPAEAEPTPARQESVQQEQPVISRQESPVTVEEKKVEVKPARPQEKPAEKPVEKSDPKPLAEYKAPAQGEKPGEGKPVSQGDKPKAAGDQGSPQGTPDAKALYGQSGGGRVGVQLELAGWTWDDIPQPNTPPNESGRIVFEIRVNTDGELESYRVIERSVGPEAERACRETIEKLTFTRKDGALIPAISVGKITFILRSQ